MNESIPARAGLTDTTEPSRKLDVHDAALLPALVGPRRLLTPDSPEPVPRPAPSGASGSKPSPRSLTVTASCSLSSARLTVARSTPACLTTSKSSSREVSPYRANRQRLRLLKTPLNSGRLTHGETTDGPSV